MERRLLEVAIGEARSRAARQRHPRCSRERATTVATWREGHCSTARLPRVRYSGATSRAGQLSAAISRAETLMQESLQAAPDLVVTLPAAQLAAACPFSPPDPQRRESGPRGPLPLMGRAKTLCGVSDTPLEHAVVGGDTAARISLVDGGRSGFDSARRGVSGASSSVRSLPFEVVGISDSVNRFKLLLTVSPLYASLSLNVRGADAR